MSEEQVVAAGRRRRSVAEVRRLVDEFVQSGFRQGEFCRLRGLALNTLKRYLKQDGQARKEGAGCALVAVEVAATLSQAPAQDCLAVVLSAGRRIEVGAGFDAATLLRLVRVLESL
jgi:hypothetical protein